MYVDVTIIQLHLIIIIIIVTRRQQRPRLRIASRSKKNESSDNTKRVLLSLILYPVSKKKTGNLLLILSELDLGQGH